MDFSGFFHLLQATTSQNIFIRKNRINQLHLPFITKWDQRYYKVGQLWCTTKNSKNYYKICSFFTTKQGKWYYKVSQVLQTWAKFSGQLPITENDYSNVAGTSLHELFSVLYIVFQILQKFRNILFKIHLKNYCSCSFSLDKNFHLKSAF